METPATSATPEGSVDPAEDQARGKVKAFYGACVRLRPLSIDPEDPAQLDCRDPDQWCAVQAEFDPALFGARTMWSLWADARVDDEFEVEYLVVTEDASLYGPDREVDGAQKCDTGGRCFERSLYDDVFYHWDSPTYYDVHLAEVDAIGAELGRLLGLPRLGLCEMEYHIRPRDGAGGDGWDSGSDGSSCMSKRFLTYVVPREALFGLLGGVAVP